MAILFRSTPAATARWRPLLARLMPGREIRFWPEIGDPAGIEYALVWQPEPGLLARLPKLRLIVGSAPASTICCATPSCRAMSRSCAWSTRT